MIPIVYKLREKIRFEARGDSFLVISEVPLNVVHASKRAVRVLRLCDGLRTLSQIAHDARIADENPVFKICDYFNRRSVLETHVARNDGYYLSITVIIPTRDRGASAVECLESIYSQDYPPDRIEVIVIDDGSLDETQKLVSAFSCKLIVNPSSHGQSYCRNIGAREAKNEILAFLDDDCVPSRTWLRDLVPYLQWEKVGAVGGYVDGYSGRSLLDRYEKEFSLLNLGKHIFRSMNDRFFVPTCNMLVRKNALGETGGIRETLHIGEDVDFCWRLHDAGWQALYVPAGTVMHRHRNTLGKWMRRRADYGTSEAALSELHPQRRKTLQWRPLAGIAFFCACLAIAFRTPYPLVGTLLSYVGEASIKTLRLRKKSIRISFAKVCFSVLRMYMSYSYMMSYHLARYYLVLFFLLGFSFHTLWFLAIAFLMLAASVDYSTRCPRLAFPAFLFYYILDHISYQAGVLTGCLRARSFRTYLVRHTRRLEDEV